MTAINEQSPRYPSSGMAPCPVFGVRPPIAQQQLAVRVLAFWVYSRAARSPVKQLSVVASGPEALTPKHET